MSGKQRNDNIIPRLSSGAGDGVTKMCAMQVVSWQNGDTQITDYPAYSAKPLARLVQSLNDLLAGPDGFLSPENSVIVLDLGWQTVGTAGVNDAVHALWIAEVLDNPVWGVVQFAKGDGVAAIRRIAALHRDAAAGVVPFAWQARGAAGSACSDARNDALRAENVTLRAELAAARDELAIANALSNRRSGW